MLFLLQRAPVQKKAIAPSPSLPERPTCMIGGHLKACKAKSLSEMHLVWDKRQPWCQPLLFGFGKPLLFGFSRHYL